MAGSGLTAIAFAGFANVSSKLWVYYVFYVVFTLGYMLSGPIPHQLIVSRWFTENRGKAMGIVYVGLGLMGSVGSLLVKPLTERFGFRGALVALGAIVLIAWPIAILFLRDRPFRAEEPHNARSYRELLTSYPFWLLLIGSFCAIGAVGSINFHMKFVFLDQGFEKGPAADAAWRTASVLILWSSIAGRLLVGVLADRFSKKIVMTATFALVAATVPALLLISPSRSAVLYVFAVLFGFGLGADYMLIPLMAAEQFGVNSLSRAMAIILPVNTIGQTWLPYLVSILRDRLGNYSAAMNMVLAVAAAGAVAIAILPKNTWQKRT